MNVYFLSLKKECPNRDFWDFGFIEDFISGNMWQPPNFPEFETHEVNSLPSDERAIVVLPARHHADMADQLNKELAKIDHVVLFLLGDEEASFPVEEISHLSIHIWVQNPHPGRHDAYNKLGTGYPPQSQKIIPTFKSVDKSLTMYFSGQVTHARRQEMWNVVTHYEAEVGGCLVERTRGFTQGVPHEEYYKHLVEAKFAPCPSGAVIPDSFRLFEALECMAVPIADDKNSSGTISGYWDWLFGGESPFPKLTEWDRLYGILHEEQDWYKIAHKTTAWWIGYKRDFAYKVMEQLHV